MVKSGLLCAVLTQHSTKFTPPDTEALASPCPNSYPLANMDSYRSSTLVDKFPTSDELIKKVHYRWATRCDEEMFDGSVILLLQRFQALLLRVIDGSTHTDADASAIQELGRRLACVTDSSRRWEENEYGEKVDGQDWTESMDRMQVLVHQPLMELQPDTDQRYDLDCNDGGADTPFALPTGELVIGGRVFRRCDSASAMATSAVVRLNYSVEVGDNDLRTDLHLNVEFDPTKSAYVASLCRLTEGYQGQIVSKELQAVVVPTSEARGLLVFAEMAESELAQARRSFAPDYVRPILAGLVAATCTPCLSTRQELFVSLIAAHTGSVICHDVPDSRVSAAATWMWDREQLWHEASNDQVVTRFKAALMELRELSAELPRKRLFDPILERADTLFSLRDMRRRRKDEKKKKAAADDADVRVIQEDNEADGDAEDESESMADADQAEQLCKEKAALVHELKDSNLAAKFCNSSRLLLELTKAVLPWLVQRNFAMKVAATKAVAFHNGIQDFDPPYAFHMATPLDLVANPLPYDLAPEPKDDQERDELQAFTLARYIPMFHDKDVALREMDKDAVTLLGKCSVMGEANIRMHLGPYDEATGCWGSRVGKNLRLTLNQSVFGKLLDASKAAGFLSLVMQPGKAYSMFDGIEHVLSTWVDEAQNVQANKTTGRQELVPWNTGLILKLCPASSDPKFAYRVEHGKEKTVTLKMQNLNILSNYVRVPSKGIAGFRTKLEVSPYPRIGLHTQAEVDASEAAGKPAFLIDKSLLEFVKADPGKVARYFVERAIAIDKDASSAHPKTAKHVAATQHLFSISKDTEQLDDADAMGTLHDYLDVILVPCDGSSSSGQPAIDIELRDGDDMGARCQDLQEAIAGSQRCFCRPQRRQKASSCHFEIKELANCLLTHNEGVYRHFVQGSGATAKTSKLTMAVQAYLGLKTAPLKQYSNYPRGSIFGWRIRRPVGQEDGENGVRHSLNLQFGEQEFFIGED